MTAAGREPKCTQRCYAANVCSLRRCDGSGWARAQRRAAGTACLVFPRAWI